MADVVNHVQPKLSIFVLMPFDRAFNDVYKLGIKAAAQEVGSRAERVDEQDFTDPILAQIIGQIKKADVIIAEMTGQNPNVFYELGYAHALGKIVLLVTKDLKDIPFDLNQYPCIIYGGSIDTLKTQLVKKLKWVRGKVASKSEKILYDSSKDLRPEHFESHIGQIYDSKTKKHVGPGGIGTISVKPGGILNISRTNAVGRFEAWLTSVTIRKGGSSTGNIKVYVRFEAIAQGGKHNLDIVVKEPKTGHVPAHKLEAITIDKWTLFECDFLVSASSDYQLRLYDQDVSQAPSSIQLRNLMLVQRAT